MTRSMSAAMSGMNRRRSPRTIAVLRAFLSCQPNPHGFNRCMGPKLRTLIARRARRRPTPRSRALSDAWWWFKWPIVCRCYLRRVRAWRWLLHIAAGAVWRPGYSRRRCAHCGSTQVRSTHGWVPRSAPKPSRSATRCARRSLPMMSARQSLSRRTRAAAPAGRLPRAHPAPGPHRLLPARLTGKRRRGALRLHP